MLQCCWFTTMLWCFMVLQLLRCCSAAAIVAMNSGITTVLLVLQCCSYAGATVLPVLQFYTVLQLAAVLQLLQCYGALPVLRCCSWHHGAAVL
jgi:hypothetical protein